MIPSDSERIAFWAKRMDEAYAFMLAIADYPVEECGEGFTSLTEAVASTGVEVRFSDTPVIDGVSRIFQLRTGLIEPFLGVCRAMNDRGWLLKVEDGYRTRHIQKNLARKPNIFDAVLKSVLWETGGRTPDRDFMAKRVAALIAMSPKVGTHMSGSAIDISVFDRTTGQEIDRGRPYLETSELTPMDSPFVSAEARKNRSEITALMRRFGFMDYPFEFWHYNAGDAYDEYINKTGRPGRYGAVDWDPKTNRVTPIENPTARLNTAEEIAASVEAALKRLGSH